MKKLHLLIFFYIGFLFFTAPGCEQEEYVLPHSIESIEQPSFNMEPLSLGEPKAITWTVENMTQAYENLKANPHASRYPGNPNSRSNVDYQITTTHYYYRFLPTDSIQYETLINDDELSVSDTPFEYDVQDDGVNYVDPQFQGTDFEFTYYYSVADVNYSIPQGIQVDILANLHFTNEDAIGDNPTTEEEELIDFYYDLNLEAQKISGELTEEEKQELTYKDDPSLPQSMSYDQVIAQNIPFADVIIVFSEIDPLEKRRRWRPSGTITVEDDDLCKEDASVCIIGVRNAYVKVRKWGWLVFRRAETDINGFFETSSTRTRRVKYAVHFQPRQTGLFNRTEFVVKAGTIYWDARHRGTNTYNRQPWNQHFSQGSHSHFYALVHNAAADFIFDWVPQFGLHAPRRGLKISAKFNDVNSNFIPFLVGNISEAFVSHIRVARLNETSSTNPLGLPWEYRGSFGVYATTIHEITHASHREMDPGMFLGFSGLFNWNERLLLVESWAEGVETILTNHRYNNVLLSGTSTANVGWNSFRQTRTVNQMNEYTPMFIDLNDALDQSTLPPIGLRPVDRVSGYSIDQMQSGINDARELEDVRNALETVFSNPTEIFLDDIFTYAQFVLDNNL